MESPAHENEKPQPRWDSPPGHVPGTCRASYQRTSPPYAGALPVSAPTRRRDLMDVRAFCDPGVIRSIETRPMSARTIHPFPARMAPEIALEAIPELNATAPINVIDPMCGSGTVLSAAVNRGQNAVGVDIDPLAVLMSKVATTHIDVDRLTAAAENVALIAERDAGVVPWTDNETDRFVDYWFGPAQRADLVALISAINGVTDNTISAALRVAMSRIIITKTPQASLAADTSHSRPHRVLTDSNYDVLAGFRRSVKVLSKLLLARDVRGTAQVTRGDSRLLDGVHSGSMDLAVTSPPYLNALDYMRGHKMALVWFGHSIADLRALRGRSIGAERALDVAPLPYVNDLVSFIESDVAAKERLPQGTLRRYASDMVGFASAIARVLKPSADVILVVGNSTLRGNYIRNDLIAQHALENAGFVLSSRQQREIPATSRYMPINTASDSSALRNRMRHEVVLRMSRRALS